MTGGYALTGAAQVLRPPRPGLPYLRHDEAATLTLSPGDVLIAGDRLTERAEGLTRVDCRDAAVIPGLVDCHTHLPFAGWRAGEYEQKVTGVPYAEIARRGGGIRSSSRALAAASDEDVLAQASALAGEMLRHGTTTLECKSGYGLSIEAELRALRLASELDARVVQSTRSTALLAHAVPQGHTADSWLDTVADVMSRVTIETAASALDIFVESVAFANEHLERMGALAREHNLDLRAHVEQLASHGSVPVALAAGARSLDHLSCLPAEHVEPLAGAECAAVLLPGAEFLGAEHRAPGRALADAGAICVLSTDLNPGTSPVLSLPLVAGLGVRMYGWSAREALLALTLNAAWVLRLSGELGSLEPGKRADVVILDGPVESIAYRFGHNPVAAVFVAGRPAWIRDDQRWRFPS